MTIETLVKANQLMERIKRANVIINFMGVFGETVPENPMRSSNYGLANIDDHGSFTLNEGERHAIVMAMIEHRKSLEAELESM